MAPLSGATTIRPHSAIYSSHLSRFNISRLFVAEENLPSVSSALLIDDIGALAHHISHQRALLGVFYSHWPSGESGHSTLFRNTEYLASRFYLEPGMVSTSPIYSYISDRFAIFRLIWVLLAELRARQAVIKLAFAYPQDAIISRME